MDTITAAHESAEADTDPSRPRRRLVIPVAQDAAALLVLLAATVHLAGDDGGRPLPPLVTVSVVGLLALPFLAAELARLGRVAVVVVAGLVAGPAMSWAVAPYRAGGARPLLVAAVTVLAFLAARRVWRRPWGPPVVLAAVTAAVARSWLTAAWAWWGTSMVGGEPTWLALSWHNQSGALMAAAAVAALALVLSGPPWLRAPAMIAVAACTAGAWLSGSRGALLAAAAGAAVVVAGARRHGWRQVVSGVAVAAVLSVGSTGALLALGGGDSGGQPLTSREQSAGHNLRARVGHTEAALRMALAHPLTGTGPGSYRWASRPVYPDGTNLTSSAHNEYAEAIGETGLVGGLPVALAAIALALLAARVVRRPDDAPDHGAATGDGTPAAHPSSRHAGRLAAAGVVVVLGIHAGADFDWEYGLLAVLLAVAGAVLHAELAREGDASVAVPPAWRRAGVWLGGGAIAAGVAVALTVGTVTVNQPAAPWDLDAATWQAAAAVREGDAVAADDAIARLGRWNPGSEALPTLRALAGWQSGEAGAADVVASIDPRRTPNQDQLLAVELLTGAGHLDEATAILDDLEPVLEARARWGSGAGLELVAAHRAAIDAARAG